MTHVPETGNENRYHHFYRFFSASFSYRLRLVSKFLVPETNMADDTVAVGAVGILVAIAAKEKVNRKRTIWMQPWIANRQTQGAYHTLLQELDDKSYRNFLRMDRGSFEMLLHKVAPYIRRQDTTMRLSITPVQRNA